MRRMTLYILLGIIVSITIAGIVFLHQPSFGRLPKGERLERIKRSPNYREGEFRNIDTTILMTSHKSRPSGIWSFLFRKVEGLRPDEPIPAIKTALRKIPLEENALVWFGHSSYLLQVDEKRILVDPVFCMASPVSFVNKPFRGTEIYSPDDMPDIDYLVISHDHWDHLDYHTVKQLKGRIGKVVCPLGVGEHFEHWGFDKSRIIELDWKESATLSQQFIIHCLPSRHFSGRGLTPNQTLWASFLLETPDRKIFIGGDGGYGSHLKQIGEQFPDIDLAILENGQYNEDWKYIHTMPSLLEQTIKDLRVHRVLTVHHSKYALARHRWDEPLKNARNLSRNDSLTILMPVIGEVVNLF